MDNRPAVHRLSECNVQIAETSLGGRIVARVSRAAAFFDLDKTIIAKSSTLAFGRPFYQGGLINRRAVVRSAYAQFVFALVRGGRGPDGSHA